MLQFDQIVTVIGITRTGLSTAGLIAKHCKSVGVLVTDKSPDAVKKCSEGKIPFYEPGLGELIKETQSKSLFFTSNLKQAAELSEIVFVCVDNSGSTEDIPCEPSAYLSFAKGKCLEKTQLEHVARLLGQSCSAKPSKKIIVDRSLVPYRTSATLKNVLDANSQEPITVVSNPAVYSYGECLKDLEHPMKMLIGGDNPECVNAIVELYKQWVPVKVIQTTKSWHAELATLMTSCLEAQRIVSMNTLYSLCEKCQVPGNQIGAMVTSTATRLSLGFESKRLTNSVLHLIHLLRYFGLTQSAEMWESVLALNQTHIRRLHSLAVEKMMHTVEGKKMVVYGVSTVPNCDDLVGSSSLALIKSLIGSRAYVTVCDPHCSSEQIQTATKGLTTPPTNVGDYLTIGESIVDAVKGSSALFVMTPLPTTVNYQELYDSMQHPSYLFDAVGDANVGSLEKIGFSVFRVGG